MEREEIRAQLEDMLDSVDMDVRQRVDVKDETAIREGLGLDSLQITELLFEIEERLNVKISDDEARGVANVGQLIDIITSKMKTAQNEPKE